MKNGFSEAYSKFINIAPKNWTQTDLTRFVKFNADKPESEFLESQKNFKALGEIRWHNEI